MYLNSTGILSNILVGNGHSTLGIAAYAVWIVIIVILFFAVECNELFLQLFLALAHSLFRILSRRHLGLFDL